VGCMAGATLLAVSAVALHMDRLRGPAQGEDQQRCLYGGARAPAPGARRAMAQEAAPPSRELFLCSTQSARAETVTAVNGTCSGTASAGIELLSVLS